MYCKEWKQVTKTSGSLYKPILVKEIILISKRKQKMNQIVQDNQKKDTNLNEIIESEKKKNMLLVGTFFTFSLDFVLVSSGGFEPPVSGL